MGTVIGICSAKGGVGKSLIAANLAVALGLGCRTHTALVDLIPGIGTADLLLNLDPERSWADLKEVFNELTSQHLQLAVTPYQPGLDLLAAPSQIDWNPSMTKSDLAALLSALQSEYEIVLADLPSGVNDITYNALQLVDLRLILLTPDGPALRSTIRYLECLPDNGSSIGLVINQFGQGAAVTPAEIKDHLGINLAGVLPIDPQGVWANVSYGQPCALYKSSKLGTAIRKLAVRLLKMIKS